MLLLSKSVFLLVTLLGNGSGFSATHWSRPFLVVVPTKGGKLTTRTDLSAPEVTLSLSSVWRQPMHRRKLASRAGFADGDDEDDDVKNLVSERKTQVEIGYQATGMIYFFVAILHLVRTGLNFSSLYYIFAGPVLLSGLSFMLKEAVGADSDDTTPDKEISLQSNTFKRFNWILIGHSLISLALPIIDPAHFAKPFFIVPPASALWNAFKGHVYGGVIGWIPTRHICAVFTDIQEGWTSTLSILRRFQRESWLYIALGTMIGGMTLVKLKEVLGLLLLGVTRHHDYSSLALASRISRLARFMVLNEIILTLKDAADRQQLWRSPYWQVNGLVAMALASLTGYLLAPSVPVASISSSLGVASLFFATVTGYHAFRGSRQAINQ